MLKKAKSGEINKLLRIFEASQYPLDIALKCSNEAIGKNQSRFP